MDIRRAALTFAVGIITASCSEKSTPEGSAETEREPKKAGSQSELRPPSETTIGKDCAAFVRLTQVAGAPAANTDCPGCPAEGTNVLSFRQMTTNAISCAGEACTVVVSIRAVFNPGSGQTMAGGLTAWIPPEQRTEYLSGRTPAGDQVYRVQITYRWRGDSWRAIEFARAPDE